MDPVSEIFPLEIPALAIAVFYLIGTLVGGVGAPYLFGALISTGSRWYVSAGYLLGALLMLAGGVTEWFGELKPQVNRWSLSRSRYKVRANERPGVQWPGVPTWET